MQDVELLSRQIELHELNIELHSLNRNRTPKRTNLLFQCSWAEKLAHRWLAKVILFHIGIVCFDLGIEIHNTLSLGE